MGEEIFDIETWRRVFVESVAQLGATVADFLPKLAGAALIVTAGWLVSRLAERGAGWLLPRLGMDRAANRLGLSGTLERAGLSSPLSQIVASVLYWVLMLTFLLSGAQVLGLAAVTATVDRLVGFLPNVIAAGVVALLGLLLARFARNTISSGAAAANLPEARRLGAAASGALMLVIVVLALEQLGIETAVLVTVLTAVLAAFGLTVGVAFALGARPIITHILAGHYLRQSLPPDSSVEVRGQRGTVERIGSVDTLFRDAEHTWSVPNGQLLEEVVQR